MKSRIQNWAFIVPKYSREISEYFEGVLDFLKTDPSVFLHSYTFTDTNLRDLATMDGIISYTIPPPTVMDILATRKRRHPPMIAITMCKPTIPTIAYARIDPNGVAERIVNLLSRRRCQSFAFCSSHAPFFTGESAALLLAYRKRIFSTFGKMPRLYRPEATLSPNLIPMEVEKFAKWLHHMPKPCGMLVHGDDVARKMLDSCRLKGIAVPTEIRVIGTGNSAIYCERTYPSLSSYSVDHLHAGFESARALRQMIDNGLSARNASFSVALPDVTERASTIDEHGAARLSQDARDYIIDRLVKGNPPSTTDIAHHLNVSLRKIEGDFRSVYGHTLFEEIANRRIEILCKYLRTSNEPIRILSARAGFGDISQATRVFKAKKGITMSAYRNSR